MSNNIANPDAPNLPYYVATYQGRSVAIKRDAYYQITIKLVQKSIARLRGVDAQDILISTALTDYGGSVVQISEEIWPDVLVNGESDNVVPAQQDESIAAVAVAADPTTEYTHSRAVPHQVVRDTTNRSVYPIQSLSITVRTPSQQLLKLGDLRSSSTIDDIESLIETTYNIPAILQRLELLGQPLDNTKTLEQCKITDRAILDLHLNARQYMIYLYPDPTLESSERFFHRGVQVQLSLNRAWELAALCLDKEAPPEDYVQSVSWTVDVAWGDPTAGPIQN